jgi:hypothetical protein
MGDDAMGEKKQRSPFLTNKPSGTLPKRDKDDSLLLNLNRKMKDHIDKLKKNR